MPTVDSFVPGAPCWLDLSTSDLEKAKGFYGEIFGWEFADAGKEFGHYHMITKDGRAVAGAMANQNPGQQPDGWCVYLCVEDAAATSQAIKDAGGNVMFEPMPVGSRGTMLLAVDSAGAFIGAWQKGDFAGFEVLAEPGAPMWFETLTRRYDESVSFYENAFGWKTAVRGDSDEFRYTTLGEGENALAGIMDANHVFPDDMPSHWQFYVAVEDVDETMEKATHLGGHVMRPAQDTEFGRLTQLQDPTGALLSIAAAAH